MSCQQDILAGSSACIHVAKELIAASRWLRVRDAVAPFVLQPAEERRDGAGGQVVEGEPGRRD
jgi:hypothetical protein